MSSEHSNRSVDELITAACHGLVDSFERLNGLMVEPHVGEMAPRDIARNLLEFGRAQISGEPRPTEPDRALIAKLADDTDLDGELAPRYCAYVCGCVLGWAAVGELDRARLDDAIAIVRRRSAELFPDTR